MEQTDEIIESQRREIKEMEWLIEDTRDKASARFSGTPE
jgi:hypothetical protein